MEIFRTDESGEISFSVDGKGRINVEEFID